MFLEIPPFKEIKVNDIVMSMPRAYQIYHGLAYDTTYLSIGNLRKKEHHCIFHYTVRGHGRVTYKGVSYKTSEGEGFFNIINEETSGYGYPEDGKEPWEFIVISFDGGNIRQIVSDLSEKRVVYNINNRSAFSAMCKRFLNASDVETKLTFLPRLLSMIREDKQISGQMSARFHEIVKRDLLKNPKISVIAGEMNISREHLQREYFKQTGITPAKYLNDKRFEELCYLLSTNATEAEICKVMNFSSVSGMSIFFKKNSGTTPKRYRKNGYFTI